MKSSSATSLPRSMTRFILLFVREQWVKFSLLVAAFAIWAASDALFPYFLKRIIDTVQQYQGDRAAIYSMVTGLVIALIIMLLLAELLMRVQGILQIYVFPAFRASIRRRVFDYVTRHSHEYFSSHFAGNLSKKLSDLSISGQNLMEVICFQFVTAGTLSLVILVLMWMTQPLFAIILFVWMCFHFSIIFMFLRREMVLSATHSEAVSVLSGKIVDVFTNILNVRLFSHHRYEASYLKKFQDDEIVKAKKALWVVEGMRICLGLNGLCLLLGMLGGLLYGWVHHRITIGDFTQILMQSWWLLGWLWFISFQLSFFSREMGTVKSALRLVTVPQDVADRPQAVPLVIARGDICFKEVSFHYSNQRTVFQHLNVTIPAGQKVGLVGFSGSGKSTFVNLILRFYDIVSGQILIDGQNIQQVTQSSLRAQIAMIPQDPILFHRSLMENIRYGRLDATDEEVKHAAVLSHCHEFIAVLDQQYDSLVGERGIKLSGGQRQRIAIARAILKNARILILDEATSSLDSMTEKLIQASLRALMQDKTTIVIAHRLSTLSNMDRILVFHQGRIVEEGTITTLLQANGHFAMLWRMQTAGFLPDDEADANND